MKKYLIIIVAVLSAALLIFAGCSSETEASEDTETQKVSVMEISFDIPGSWEEAEIGDSSVTSGNVMYQATDDSTDFLNVFYSAFTLDQTADEAIESDIESYSSFAASEPTAELTYEGTVDDVPVYEYLMTYDTDISGYEATYETYFIYVMSPNMHYRITVSSDESVAELVMSSLEISPGIESEEQTDDDSEVATQTVTVQNLSFDLPETWGESCDPTVEDGYGSYSYISADGSETLTATYSNLDLEQTADDAIAEEAKSFEDVFDTEVNYDLLYETGLNDAPVTEYLLTYTVTNDDFSYDYEIYYIFVMAPDTHYTIYTWDSSVAEMALESLVL